MFTVDLSLPFSALLVLIAGAVGYLTRGAVIQRGHTDVDRTAEISAFEQRNQRTLGR